jgi:hypothetical protein
MATLACVSGSPHVLHKPLCIALLLVSPLIPTLQGLCRKRQSALHTRFVLRSGPALSFYLPSITPPSEQIYVPSYIYRALGPGFEALRP